MLGSAAAEPRRFPSSRLAPCATESRVGNISKGTRYEAGDGPVRTLARWSRGWCKLLHLRETDKNNAPNPCDFRDLDYKNVGFYDTPGTWSTSELRPGTRGVVLLWDIVRDNVCVWSGMEPPKHSEMASVMTRIRAEDDTQSSVLPTYPQSDNTIGDLRGTTPHVMDHGVRPRRCLLPSSRSDRTAWMDRGYATGTLQIALNDKIEYTGGCRCFFVNDRLVEPCLEGMSRYPVSLSRLDIGFAFLNYVSEAWFEIMYDMCVGKSCIEIMP